MKNILKLISQIAIVVVFLSALRWFLHDRPGPAEGQTTAERLLFTWTGDDGNVGTCAGLELRWRAAAIAGTDTLSWWNAATKFTGLYPVPKVAGTADSLFVTGLPNGTQLYAIVKAVDEAGNWSSYSNVAGFLSRDFIPPGRISDLRVGILVAPFTPATADATELDTSKPAAVLDLTPPGAPRAPSGAGLTA